MRRSRFSAAIAVAVMTVVGAGGVAAGARPAPAAAAPGGQISVAMLQPGLLSPYRQTVMFDQVMLMYTSLVVIDDQNRVTMGQAQSVTSTDAQNWTITLKPGWTFHNGEPVTASSYVDGWNAEALKTNKMENNGFLMHIDGYAALNPAEGEPTVTQMSGLKVVDDLTFTVKLTAPDGQFPLQLTQAQTAFYPMSKAGLADPAAQDTMPIGNGPFMMTKPYKDTEDLELVAYDKYQGKQPTSGKITFKLYADPNTAYADALADNVDIAGVPPAKMSVAKSDFGDRVYFNAAPGIAGLGVSLWDQRFENPKLRKAISMSIDRAAVNKAIFAGALTPATSFTPAAEIGTPENACGESCVFNPEQAKALLAEAGGWTGPLEIHYPGGLGIDEIYQAYANQIRQNLGVDAVARPSTDWASFASAREGAQFSGLYFSRWGALYPSMQNTLHAFYTKEGGCPNCVAYYTDEITAALQAADAEVDQAKAIELYSKIQTDILARDLPWIPLFYETYNFVTSTKIKSMTAFAGVPIYEAVVLAG